MPPFPLPKVYEDPRWNHEWSNRPSGASWVPGAGWTNIPRRRVLKEVVPSLVDQQPRAPPLPRMDGAMEQKGRDTDVAVTLLSPSARDAAEHLRQTTQQRQRWSSGRGHQPGTRVHGSFSIRISCLWSLPPPPPIVSFMVFLFFFFKKDHAVWVFIIHIGEDIWGCFPMEILIYYIYIYISIFCKSHKVQKPSWSGERIFAKGFRFPLDPAMWIRFVPVAVGSWLEKGRKKKKDALTKDEVKRRAVFSLWLPFLPGPRSSLLTACWTSDALSAEFSLLESLGNFPHLYIGIGCLGALQLAPQKSNPHPSIWLPARGRPKAPEMLLSSGKIHVSPAGHPDRLWGLWGLVVPQSIRLSRLSGNPSIMGFVCKCCRAKKKKKKDKPYGPETRWQVFGGIVDYPRAGYRGSSQLYPKGHLAVSFISSFFFSPSIPSIFFSFLVTQGIWEGGSRSVSSVCQAWADGKFLRFLTFSLFPSSLAVFQNGLMRGSFSPQSKISHILWGRCHLLVLFDDNRYF